MTAAKEKAAAIISSVAAEDGRPHSQKLNDSTSENRQNINPADEPQRRQSLFRQVNSLDCLDTVSHAELLDTVFQPKTQLIESILCSGAYLFAGAPKVGKSFLMLQLGYHVSGGLPLWDYPTHRSTVLYLALEDDYARLQKRLSRMFGMDSIDNFYFATHAKKFAGRLRWPA